MGVRHSKAKRRRDASKEPSQVCFSVSPILFDLELNDQQTTKTDEFYGDKKSNPVDNHLQDGIEKVKS